MRSIIISAYVKNYDGQTKWMYFLIEDDDILEVIILFEVKSVLISKKNLIATLSIIQSFWKPKQSLMMMKVQIVMTKAFLS